MNTIFFAVLSIALSVMAQFVLKAGMSSGEVKEIIAHPLGPYALLKVLTNRFVLGGFLLYGLGAIVWLNVLSKWDVSKAYPLVGFGFVITFLISSLAGEPVMPIRAAGVALICAGVFLVGRT